MRIKAFIRHDTRDSNDRSEEGEFLSLVNGVNEGLQLVQGLIIYLFSSVTFQPRAKGRDSS